jgi:hypothetical protein
MGSGVAICRRLWGRIGAHHSQQLYYEYLRYVSIGRAKILGLSSDSYAPAIIGYGFGRFIMHLRFGKTIQGRNETKKSPNSRLRVWGQRLNSPPRGLLTIKIQVHPEIREWQDVPTRSGSVSPTPPNRKPDQSMCIRRVPDPVAKAIKLESLARQCREESADDRVLQGRHGGRISQSIEVERSVTQPARPP